MASGVSQYPCPTCKGKGRTTMKVVTYDKERTEDTCSIACMTCKGAGNLTLWGLVKWNNERKANLAFWCRCGNPSKEFKYYEDNPRSKVCNKHHYRCIDCGKVLQVG